MKLTVQTPHIHAIRLRCGLILILLMLSACIPATATPLQPSITPQLQPTSTQPLTTTLPEQTATVHIITPEPPSFPLSEPGPYAISKRRFAFEDASRDNRKVSITVWYPAVLPEGSTSSPLSVGTNLEPDHTGEPYPLILSSTEMANTLARYVVSFGFTWVSVNGIRSYAQMNEQMYTQPLDILFALDRAASESLEGLLGVIDANQTGVIGYSFDGYNTLALSGARIDSQYYLETCANPDALIEDLQTELSAYSCIPAYDWDAFTVKVGEDITASEDGLWHPMTDARIRAVMPMAGEGWWLFGERGLAAVDLPTLILVATEDELYPENVLIFEHLGTSDKTMISFIGLNHMMVFSSKPIARMAHFTVAFFGYHLQGREDYAQYFSKEFVAQFDDLAWGIYEE